MRRVARRAFNRTMASATVGLAVAPSAWALTPPPPARLHWAWVHGGRDLDDATWRARLARAREAGIGALLVSGGDTDRMADLAGSEGLAYHRWIWTLNRNGDSWVREHHPEWFSVNRDGESSLDHPPYVDYYRWLCPSRPDVVRYLADVVAEVATQPGLTGVHLDYVRHPDVILPRGLWEKYGLVQDVEHPPFDFCYCEVCRSQFRTRSGTDPLDLADPTADEAWRSFRWESVTRLVNVLAEVVHAEGRQITAAVFPTPTIARRLVRQAWEQWRLDGVVPMLYHRFYEEDLDWIGASVREGLATLPTSRGLYAGLYIPDLPPAQLAEAARVAMGAGAHGVSLFELGGVSEAHWNALAEALASA